MMFFSFFLAVFIESEDLRGRLTLITLHGRRYAIPQNDGDDGGGDDGGDDGEDVNWLCRLQNGPQGK